MCIVQLTAHLLKPF